MEKPFRKYLIVMGAGSGVRMGSALPKQFLDLGGEPVLRRTIRVFLAAVPDIRVITVLPDEWIEYWKSRVRPLLTPGLVRSMFAQMEEGRCRGLIPVVPMVDTLKVLDRGTDPLGRPVWVEAPGESVDRSRVFGAQTPQLFLSDDIKAAYGQAFDTAFTDDASVARKKGIPLSFCEGERNNFKLTSPDDLALAKLLISG